MTKVTVTISDSRRSYKEDVDLEGQREMFHEWQTNGANPDAENITFEQFHRSLLKFNANKIGKYNGGKHNHFVFGWFECFCQGDDVPGWMRAAKEPLFITVEAN